MLLHLAYIHNLSGLFSIQAQFFGGLKQTMIPVEDFSRESFKLFLDVLDGQKIHRPSMNFSSWFNLLRLADKYLVAGLDQFVVEQMVNNLREQVGLDPVLEVIYHLADYRSLAWKVSEDLFFHQAWPVSATQGVSFEQWRSQIGVGCDSEELVEVRQLSGQSPARGFLTKCISGLPHASP